MKEEIIKHDDERRTLIEFISNHTFCTSKVLYVKKKSVLGSHYHKLKDDIFFLIKGAGTAIINNRAIDFNAGDCFYVKAGIKHAFNLNKGSILLEASTTPYDKKDEYRA